MAERTLTVKILGDSRDLERAFNRSNKATQKLGKQVGGARGGITNELRTQTRAVQDITRAEQELIKVRSKKASSVGPFRVAGIGLAAGLGLFAATQAVRELGDRLEVTGREAFTTGGKLRNMVSSLTSGNLIGAFEALRATPKTLADIGFNAAEARKNVDALRIVASGLGRDVKTGLKFRGGLLPSFASEEQTRALDKLRAAQKLTGVETRKFALEEIAFLNAEDSATTATEALADSVARLGRTFITQSGALVTFAGAVDDLNRAGRGEAVGGAPAPRPRPFHASIGPLSPSQRRELDLIGKEELRRIPLLEDRLRQLNNQLKDFHGNQEQRLKILTNIKQTEAEIASINADAAAGRAADAAAAKAAAEAAARELAAKLKAARAARLEAIANERERRNAKQFFALGLSPSGGERTPLLSGLRKQLGNFEEAVKGSFLDTKKTRSVMATIRKILSGDLGKVSETVRGTIRDMLRDLNQQLKDQENGPRTLSKLLDVSDALTGLTGTAAAMARARNLLTGATFIPRQPLRATVAGVVIQHVTVNNPANFDAFTREIDKRAQRTSVGRR